MKHNEVFNALYSDYYNLFYTDKKYTAEVEYVEGIIKKFKPSARSILEYGSGTGGHGLLLQEKGYDIHGIELSEKMARIALEKGYSCQVGNIVDVSLNRKFDVCIALFHVISYITTNAKLARLFENTRKHISLGGLFIFDVWFTPAVFSQIPEVRVKRVENENVQVTRIAQPERNDMENTVVVNYTVFMKDKNGGGYQEFSEQHSMRHFGYPEIQFLAETHGFSILKSEEFLSGNKPSTNTWGVNFILQAK